MNVPTAANIQYTNLRISPDASPWRPASRVGQTGVSVFANLNNVRIKNSKFNILDSSMTLLLELLYQRVAPNAILNKGGRADDAKCHPGTRHDVIGLIERWAGDVNGYRIFWISGPAGGGKTAIMKTIAERSADRATPTVNFFFFRGDPTRNTAQPLIATLLYQLFQLYPSSAVVTAEILAERPRILDESLDEQCALMSSLFPIIRESTPAGPPIILLIDGLDECDVDGEHSRPEILRALERLVTYPDSPFRLLVASRREAPIQMTFNELPSRAHSIFLSEEYSPENDIRIFVEAEFDRIKASHPSRRFLPSHWPRASDIDRIVTKSSGQFIYAATVMRYISDPSTVPTLSLERVMGIVAIDNNSPFTNLDNIYTFILNHTSDPDTTRDILSVKLVVNKRLSDLEVLCHSSTRYNAALIESCISNISAIVRLTEHGNIEFYHASLADFLTDHARSGAHWIDTKSFRAEIVVVLWRKHIVDNTFPKDLLFQLFVNFEKPSPDVTDMLLNASLDWMILRPGKGLSLCPLRAIKKMYYDNDDKIYKHIVRRIVFMAAFYHVNIDRLQDIPHAEGYYRACQKWKWGFRILNGVRGKN